MPPSAAVTIDPSYWSLAPLIAAPAVGLFVLVIRMLGRSGRVGLSLSVLARSKADVATLMAYDCFGGMVCVAGVLLFGVTRPAAVVDGFENLPWLAWMALGAAGPLVSAGILDRLPLRGLADVLARSDDQLGEGKVSQHMLTQVRFEAAQRVLRCLYEDSRVQELIEADEKRARAGELTRSGALRFDDVARELLQYETKCGEPLPEALRHAIDRREHWPTGEDPGRDTEILVETALVEGFTRPIEIACRVAEARL